MLHLRRASLPCNSLQQFEFLPIDRRLNDWNEEAFHQALQTWAGIHRRGNFDMSLLFYSGHGKGRHRVASRVDILLNQDSAWFWFADPLVGRLFDAEGFDFEADNRAGSIASLLDLQIIQALLGKDVGVSMLIISNRSVDVFWTGIQNGRSLHGDLCHRSVPFLTSLMWVL